MVRESTLVAPGGFPTFEGMASGKAVHWIGNDLGEARKHEKIYAKKKDRLDKLLYLNAFTMEGLTSTEHNQACDLIEKLTGIEKVCWHCQTYEATAQNNLCITCLKYTLIARK